MTLTWLGLIILLYYAIHSLLAMNAVKERFAGRLIRKGYYRLVYNILAVLLLLPLIWAFFAVEKTFLLGPGLYLYLPGLMFLFAGAVWIYRSFEGYHFGEFSGLSQVKSGSESEMGVLNLKGLNAQVRHPLYFGSLLATWGAFLIWPTDALLLFAVLTSIYLYVGSLLEEKKLEQRFGETYRLYQRKVPMLLPFKWRQNL